MIFNKMRLFPVFDQSIVTRYLVVNNFNKIYYNSKQAYHIIVNKSTVQIMFIIPLSRRSGFGGWENKFSTFFNGKEYFRMEFPGRYTSFKLCSPFTAEINFHIPQSSGGVLFLVSRPFSFFLYCLLPRLL